MASAGVVCRAGDRFLLLRRSENVDKPGLWAFPGGGIDEGETPDAAARRELMEEAGVTLDVVVGPVCTDGDFSLFLSEGESFNPTLNDEHDGYVWASLSDLPQPLHPGTEEMLKQVQDVRIASDAALAFDKSVRSYDHDGRLRVEQTNISKANICGYLGSEIPGWRELGLDPKQIYDLLRDPEELAKAAPTFNGIPLLNVHVPSTAWDHPHGKVVGTTGTDCIFEAPYLKNSLVVWTQDAIDGIESQKQRELSSAYRYTPDMTPGVFEGKSYHGVMRDIKGNHVAVIVEGRVGPDVVVGDSKLGLEKKFMRLGADGLYGMDADWDEGKHPRGEGGKFGAGSGSSKGSEGKKPSASENFAALEKSQQKSGKKKAPSKTEGLEKVPEAAITANLQRYGYTARNLESLAPKMKTYNGKPLKVVDGELYYAKDSSINPTEKNPMKTKAMSKKAVLAKGALMASVRLAADSKLDLNSVLEGVTHANWNESKPKILAALKPVLASDANLADITRLLDHMDGEETLEEAVEATPAPALDADPMEELLAFLQGKLSDEDLAVVAQKVSALGEPAAAAPAPAAEPAVAELVEDEPAPTPGAPAAPGKESNEDLVSRSAMDSAVRAAAESARKGAVSEMNAIRDAEEAIKPYVGKLAMSFDSAPEVYKAALETLGVEVKDVHPSAFRAVLMAQKKPGEQVRLAQDSAAPQGLGERFPGLAQVRKV